MAPSVITEEVPVIEAKTLKGDSIREPLKPSGKLEEFEYFDVTPTIGREFPKASLAEWLKAPNSDELIRDLAITGTQLQIIIVDSRMLTGLSLTARRRLLPRPE